ncbi:hypothetical protein HQ533_03655 [Candidatus Woesearchaeota archaeon]|nr:hypothetical protein [Candidatus Woesearchaeota archaeon]
MWFDAYNYVLGNYDPRQQQHFIRLLKRGILMDTAPLFILIVGHYDNNHSTSFIEDFEAKKGCSEKTYKKFDYKYLLAFLNSFGLGKAYKLVITSQIFTELIKHIYEIVDNPFHFKQLLEESFQTKWYLHEHYVEFQHCLRNNDFSGKKIEIGELSITILSKKHEKKYIGILTDDKPFAVRSNEKYKLLTIYYNDIRRASMQKTSKKIPAKLLVEPEPL